MMVKLLILLQLMLLLIHLKFKKKIIDQTNDNDRNDVDMLLPLKYLSSFWRAFEMPLINCEINLDLNFHSG